MNYGLVVRQAAGFIKVKCEKYFASQTQKLALTTS
jgi:hypothetical protein